MKHEKNRNGKNRNRKNGVGRKEKGLNHRPGLKQIFNSFARSLQASRPLFAGSLQAHCTLFAGSPQALCPLFAGSLPASCTLPARIRHAAAKLTGSGHAVAFLKVKSKFYSGMKLWGEIPRFTGKSPPL